MITVIEYWGTTLKFVKKFKQSIVQSTVRESWNST